MRLFRRRGSDSADLASGQDILAGQTINTTRIDWRRAVPRLLLVIVALTLIVLIIMWMAGAFSNEAKPGKSPVRPTESSKQANKEEAKKPASKSEQGSRSSRSSQPAQTPASLPADESTSSRNSDRTPSRTPSSSPSTPAPQTPNQLTNTGPGEAIGLFVITTAAGTLLYQLNLRRRLSA